MKTPPESIVFELPQEIRQQARIAATSMLPFLLLIISIPLGLGWKESHHHGIPLENCFGAALFISWFLYMFRKMMRLNEETRLIVSPEGIEYKTPDVVIQTSWENIKSFQHRDDLIAILILERSAITSIKLRTRMLHLLSTNNRGFGRMIPITGFDKSPYKKLNAAFAQFGPDWLRL